MISFSPQATRRRLSRPSAAADLWGDVQQMIVITHDELSVAEVISHVESPAAGAIATFVGQRVTTPRAAAFSYWSTRRTIRWPTSSCNGLLTRCATAGT